MSRRGNSNKSPGTSILKNMKIFHRTGRTRRRASTAKKNLRFEYRPTKLDPSHLLGYYFCDLLREDAMKKTIYFLLLIFLPVLPLTANADSMDPVLTGFVSFNKSGSQIADPTGNNEFTSYAGELGAVIAPKFLGPSNTLGSYGFELSWDMSFTHINSKSKYWLKGAKNPANFAKTMQIHFEKGLPFSIQLGGVVSHVFQSGMWGLAMDIKWAFVEGFKYVPDFSIGAFVGTLLGASDLAMLDAGMNLMISKPFTLGGVVVLTPYAGYRFLYMNASSHLTTSGAGIPFVLSRRNIYRHQGLIGFTFSGAHLLTGLEVSVAPAVQSYTMKFGLIF